MTKPLHTGDIIRLVNPGYGEPTGLCTVIADQTGTLVWFRSNEPSSTERGPCFVARRSAVKLTKRKQENNP